MYHYDVWQDDNGNRHVIPQGGYRVLKAGKALLLITDDGVQYSISKGKMYASNLPVNMALLQLFKDASE